MPTAKKNIGDQSIAIHFRHNGVVEYTYSAIIRSNKKTGEMVVFIPVYNIFFTAKDFDDAVRTGDKMMDSFFQYWIEHMGFNKLNNHLIKIGFKNLGVPRRMKATIRTFPKEMADTSKFRVVTSQRMAEGMKRIA